MDSPHRIATEALRLRGWAARLLLTDAPAAAAPHAAPAAWKFFLVMEWCALPLQQRLAREGAGELLAEPARSVLDAAAALEARRIGSARAQLAMLAEEARRIGGKVVVLKGAVAVASGTPLHLVDVDVIAEETAAAGLVAALDPDRQGRWQSGQYRIAPAHPDAAAIEVHHWIHELGPPAPFLERAVPLPSVPGLWQLAPQDHLWHLLVHSVAQHRDRVARLRDLLLVRSALAASAPGEHDGVVERAATCAERNTLLAVLELARSGESAGRESVERSVRRRYFLLARWSWLGRHVWLQNPLASASELTLRPWRPVVRRLFQPPDSPSVFPGMHGLFQRAPRLDRVVRLGFRPLVLALAFSLLSVAMLEDLARAWRAPLPRS